MMIELPVCMLADGRGATEYAVENRRAMKGRNMALEIRNKCERCEKPLVASEEAYICSYECTFCSQCMRELQAICPNCGGELVRRPRPASAISGQGR
jgi:hypothetical protein